MEVKSIIFNTKKRLAQKVGETMTWIIWCGILALAFIVGIGVGWLFAEGISWSDAKKYRE